MAFGNPKCNQFMPRKLELKKKDRAEGVKPSKP